MSLTMIAMCWNQRSLLRESTGMGMPLGARVFRQFDGLSPSLIFTTRMRRPKTPSSCSYSRPRLLCQKPFRRSGLWNRSRRRGPCRRPSCRRSLPPWINASWERAGRESAASANRTVKAMSEASLTELKSLAAYLSGLSRKSQGCYWPDCMPGPSHIVRLLPIPSRDRLLDACSGSLPARRRSGGRRRAARWP